MAFAMTRRSTTFSVHRLLGALLAVSLLLPVSLARPADSDAAADALPPNLGHSLRQLVAWHRAQPGNLPASERRARLTKSLPARARRVQVNADATRAVVDVTLNGTAPLAAVRKDLTDLGAEVFAQYDAHRAGSVLSARLPLDQAETAARLPGVHAISLVHRAWKRVGSVTSQGAQILKTMTVNKDLGFDGTGITVGVISDDYDQSLDRDGNPFRTTAAQDVSSGDLPGPGNPFGHTEPVFVLSDISEGDDISNEGRAMLQIVHDLAPGARLAFQSSGDTTAALAASITSLRTQTNAPCDVIVDDVTFPDEPFFSDGPAALAALDAGTNLLLDNRPVVYVSAAGNNGDAAYQADFTPVSDADARAGSGAGNLQLAQVPAQLTAGGFHNFNPKTGKVTVGQRVKLYGDAEVSFQWDDPFIPGLVTNDYNLLVFDADGNYLPKLSGTDNNLATGKPLEIVDLPLGTGKSITYQFAITRANASAGAAQHLRYVMNGGGPVVRFTGYNNETTFGHNAGANVIGVAAYAYDKLDEPDAYSSMGPATIFLDAQGNRLAAPEVRQQPSVAAVDGVNTTFFPPGPLTLPDGTPGTDTDGDGFPNFYGTSAAAPHVAAVAALLLQAGGGPGSLTPAQILTLLQSTALPHDLDANHTSATLTPTVGATVTLAATADESDRASADNNGFHLAFDGPADQFLSKVVIDLAGTGLKFDPTADEGYPFTTGTKVGLKPTDVSATVDGENMVLTLKFVPGAFTAGRSLNFGIDRDLVTTSTDGNSADLLAGATVKVRTKGAAGVSKAQGTLGNQIGTGYSPAVGFGLVDALAAVKALLANPPPNLSHPGLTSGDLLLTTNDNRIIEVTPAGTMVQVFAVPDPVTEASRPYVELAQQAVIDCNGNLAVLNGDFAPFLTTIDPGTGTGASVTVPGWDLQSNSNGDSHPFGGIASSGHYVFATYTQLDAQSPLGLLLRFDRTNNTVQAFGDRSGTVNKHYTSLTTGSDGLLYAMVDAGAYGPVGTPVDVYDPETLTLQRTAFLNLGNPYADFNPGTTDLMEAGGIAVGPNGEFYAVAEVGDTSIYKLDANGNLLASLPLPSGTSAQGNLVVNAQGELFVGGLDPVLVDPEFKTVTVLYATRRSDPGIKSVTFVP